MTRPVLHCAHALPPAVEARLAAAYRVERPAPDADPLEALRAAADRVDAALTTVTDRVPADVFERPGRRLRIVANFGVGVNLIDLAAAKRAGVVVTNTPDVLTDCTADLTIGLMLMALRRLGEGERLVRAGRWTGWQPTHLLGRRVSGLTLGIVGMGRIGRAVAARARLGFGMTIRWTGRGAVPAPLEQTAAGGGGPVPAGVDPAEWLPLDDLLATADVVSLHCPATPETVGLLDARRIGLLRSGAVLINTARGALVDEAALAAALRTGRLLAAGLDVYREEPRVPADLLALENVVLQPHLGSATLETRTAMGHLAADNLDAFFAGGEPPNRVA